jgi:hypothetical protein
MPTVIVVCCGFGTKSGMARILELQLQGNSSDWWRHSHLLCPPYCSSSSHMHLAALQAGAMVSQTPTLNPWLACVLFPLELQLASAAAIQFDNPKEAQCNLSSTGANFDLSWLDPMPLIIKLTSVQKSPKIPSKLEISKDTTLCAKICRKLFQTQKIFKPQTGRNYKIQKKRIKNS